MLIVDTAGRLQNKTDLMAQLTKIVRVLRKRDAEAPHDTVLVLDATTGQNAHRQVAVFRDATDVSGLVVTKLDGTARGGGGGGARRGLRPACPRGGSRRGDRRPPPLRGARLR